MKCLPPLGVERPAALGATGYGRKRVPGAITRPTEIAAHAFGASWLVPDAQRRVVIVVRWTSGDEVFSGFPGLFERVSSRFKRLSYPIERSFPVAPAWADASKESRLQRRSTRGWQCMLRLLDEQREEYLG